MMQVLKELQEWYGLHCDGDWEHCYGIDIETMDNPGWMLKICLMDTLLEDAVFDTIEYGNSESKSEAWIRCYKEGENFIGMCSNGKLDEIMGIFIKWASDNTNTRPWDDAVEKLIRKCKCLGEHSDMVSYLRGLFNEIDMIPNEHPRRRELIRTFHECWNKALVVQSIEGKISLNGNSLPAGAGHTPNGT